jgi:hypothetical protein
MLLLPATIFALRCPWIVRRLLPPVERVPLLTVALLFALLATPISKEQFGKPMTGFLPLDFLGECRSFGFEPRPDDLGKVSDNQQTPTYYKSHGKLRNPNEYAVFAHSRLKCCNRGEAQRPPRICMRIREALHLYLRPNTVIFNEEIEGIYKKTCVEYQNQGFYKGVTINSKEKMKIFLSIYYSICTISHYIFAQCLLSFNWTATDRPDATRFQNRPVVRKLPETIFAGCAVFGVSGSVLHATI